MRTRLKVMLSRAASITPPLSSVVVACSAAVRRLAETKLVKASKSGSSNWQDLVEIK